MKKIIICLLLFAMPGISYSADEEKREMVEELLTLNNAETLTDNIYTALVIKAKAEITWEKMKEPVIRTFLERYSEEEIRDQIALYKSEAGDSMKSEQTKLMIQTMMLLRPVVLNKLISNLQKEYSEAEKYASIPYNNTANTDLRNAVTAQEGYYFDNKTYSNSLENILGTYGLYISDGVTLKIISADENGYSMEAFHKNGDKKYYIKGPEGAITSEPKTNEQ